MVEDAGLMVRTCVDWFEQPHAQQNGQSYHADDRMCQIHRHQFTDKLESTAYGDQIVKLLANISLPDFLINSDKDARHVSLTISRPLVIRVFVRCSDDFGRTGDLNTTH